MSQTDLLIFRHGETDWNKAHRFQGHSDIPLNQTGHEQAAALRLIIEKHQPQVIVSSDLCRARATAEIVNQNLRAQLIESAHLRECHLGDAEGMHRAELAQIYGDNFLEDWLGSKPGSKGFGFPNGESKDVHLGRMLRYLEEFCKSRPDLRKIGVSTHGGSLRRLVHHCPNAPTESVPLPNCAAYLLTFRHHDGLWSFGGALV